MSSANATVAAARHGREALATASVSLQTAGALGVALDRAVEDTAAASSALYSAEAVSVTEEAALTFIHHAIEALQRAIADVNALRRTHSRLEVAAASIARTLALLYPVVQHSLRQRRARLPVDGLSDSDARELRTMAGFPRAPRPTGRSRRPSAFDGSDRRANRDRRVFVEVEIGLSSDSQIYTGLSLDVSTGGVFVATYEPVVVGTVVSLHFVLPDGYVVNAEGIVRWRRAASADAGPGMGVAFLRISSESLAHIAGFCASRPPLYFDE